MTSNNTLSYTFTPDVSPSYVSTMDVMVTKNQSYFSSSYIPVMELGQTGPTPSTSTVAPSDSPFHNDTTPFYDNIGSQ